MKGSDFVFNYLFLLYYKCHKINRNHGRAYIDFPDWIKSKKATINHINKKDIKWFEYAVIVRINHEEIKKYLQRTAEIKPFINMYYLE